MDGGDRVSAASTTFQSRDRPRRGSRARRSATSMTPRRSTTNWSLVRSCWLLDLLEALAANEQGLVGSAAKFAVFLFRGPGVRRR